MQEPLVSICCVTYNHAPYIKQCIESFLMQETTFQIEILIHDDCSTDGTTEIISDYEKKYPDLIFPLYEEENQYQKGKASEIDFYNYKRARGKYIAYCEGDDYWTDPLKLQKQVDFMEDNPEYAICFHNFIVYEENGNKYINMEYKKSPRIIGDGIDVTNEMIFNFSYGGQPLTMLFRVSMYNFKWQKQYFDYKDNYEIYHLLRQGKGRFLDFIGGVYRKHNGGVSASSTQMDSCRSLLKCITDLYIHNSDDNLLVVQLFKVLLWSFYTLPFNEFIKWSVSILKIKPSIVIRVYYVLFKRTLKNVF